ncbi:MAG: ABC transporter permease [Clostridiales bacterium]|nr:ABC transporter permease [Clostridiales bacterium]
MRNIYRSLAVNSLAKNKIIYVPYIISSIMMITITYVIFAISQDPVIAAIEGGYSLQMIMRFGILVMYNVSFFFLIGVSRFVIKQRKKELGLYSVLGMQKKHIIRVQFLENLAVFLISGVCGTIIGAVLSKVVQLGVLKIYHAEADFGWDIQVLPALVNLFAFGLFFFVFFLINAVGILRSNTLEYMKEESKGEKKPKSNWLLAITGVILLAGGYWMSFRSQSAVKAFSLFFYAVILVILGTLALFVAGSITLLNTLKKNKDYYYKTSHFISVSGMLYRMRKNAATLATICIFATMVLVTLSSVLTLYSTVRTLAEEWYPVDFNVVYDSTSEEDVKKTRIEKLRAGAEAAGIEIENFLEYDYYNSFAGVGNGYCTTYPNYSAIETCEVFLMTLDTYNAANGTDLTLEENEVGLVTNGGKMQSGEIRFRTVDAEYRPQEGQSDPYKIVEFPHVPKISYGGSISLVEGVYFFILPSDEALTEVSNYIGQTIREYDDARDFVLINTTSDRQTQLRFYDELQAHQVEYDCMAVESRIANIDEITGLYGGLFFLGIFLSIAFLTITILNMYFSQLLQGYEDSKRFAIMRKVGLSRKEIKRSVNSQIVVVFLLPLLVAVIHTMASYPMVNRILQLFGGCEPKAFLLILGCCILVFAVVYTVAYLMTRRTYLRLVSGAYASK